MIHFTNVSKAFGTQQVLVEASFSVFLKDRCGVVGPNGAGKSTIFNLLTGEATPDAGELRFPATMRLGCVRQQPDPRRVEGSVLEYAEDAVPELRGIEARLHEIEHRLALGEKDAGLVTELGRLQTTFEQLGGYDLRNRAETALCGLGFRAADLHRPFKSFSGGWQVRAELARTLIALPDILLLDEPTNYLDLPAVEWLQDHLRNFPGTLLLISHDRFLLNSLTTRTLEVAGGRVTEYPGNYDRYVRDREERHLQLLSAKRNQDKQVEKIEQFVDRFRYKATKSNQVQSRIKQLDKIEEIVVPETAIKYSRIRLPVPPPCGAEVLRLDNLSFSYNGRDNLFKDVSLSIGRGEKVALVGMNGLGKTTLLRLIAGRLKPTGGICSTGHNVVPGYQAQDYTDTMDPELTVWDTARRAAPGREERELRNLLGSFRFSGNTIEKKVGILSGGEKVRLALARLLLSPCNFLLLDEPTTHLDIGTRESLEEALADYQGTLCVVSHDIQFIRQVATTIWTITPGAVTKYFGGYDYYHEKHLEELAAQSPKAANAKTEEPATGRDRDKTRKREQAQIRQEFSQKRKPIEQQLLAAESRVIALEAEQQQIIDLFSQPDAKVGGDQARRLGELRRDIEISTAEWERLGTELDTIQNDYRRLLDEAAGE
jgi:ATP-binding cassette subfamily F protein 3